jgi:hypothetical protein
MMMHNLNNYKKKKNNAVVTTRAATLVTLAATIIVIGATTPLVPHWMSAEATTQGVFGQDLGLATEPKAPMAVSEDGNNVYIVWWTNKSENWEVMFRASNDGGQTFGDAINLSNSTDAESQNAEIVAAGENNVYVTWWETSPMTGTSESVLRVSTDAGQTFGPVLMLGTNGTITTTGNTTTTTTATEGEEELLPNEEVVPTEEEEA